MSRTREAVVLAAAVVQARAERSGAGGTGPELPCGLQGVSQGSCRRDRAPLTTRPDQRVPVPGRDGGGKLQGKLRGKL
ncbi:hypothetical protein GCM10010345_90710 [Streptomyces canarius]|uniref:Secreted protein n=1 Tax=Streptomyces canarius TaxID=285453 RepID=A0ABQ3DCC1_9ACTN|nr:hypothetical protein GCM10010345_90710 [Streptomyces canarius]